MDPQAFLEQVANDDGLNVVDSSDAESTASNAGGEHITGNMSDADGNTSDEGEEDDQPGPAYEPAKIEVKEGKIFINGKKTPKSGVKKALMDHEGSQAGGAENWPALKKKYDAIKVAGFSDLVEAVRKAPAKPRASPNLKAASSAPKTKKAAGSGPESAPSAKSPGSKRRAAPANPDPEPAPEPVPESAPEPVPEAAPEPVPEPAPEPTPEPTPAPAPEPVVKRTNLKLARGKRKADPEPEPAIVKVPTVAAPGGQTTLADMRAAIDAWNGQLASLGVEFTLTSTTAQPPIE